MKLFQNLCITFFLCKWLSIYKLYSKYTWLMSQKTCLNLQEIHTSNLNVWFRNLFTCMISWWTLYRVSARKTIFTNFLISLVELLVYWSVDIVKVDSWLVSKISKWHLLRDMKRIHPEVIHTGIKPQTFFFFFRIFQEKFKIWSKMSNSWQAVWVVAFYSNLHTHTWWTNS